MPLQVLNLIMKSLSLFCKLKPRWHGHGSRDQLLSYDRFVIGWQICHMTEEVSVVLWKMTIWGAFWSGKLVAQMCAILPFQCLLIFLAMSQIT